MPSDTPRLPASGSPTSDGPLRNGTMSNADRRTPTRRPGASARMPATIERRKRVRFSKLPPYRPGAIGGAQELVTQIPVAVLHVDECKSDPLGVARRAHEVLDQPVELVVAETCRVAGDVQAIVEHRVPVGDARPRPRSRRPGVSSGVGQLQPDDEVAGACRIAPRARATRCSRSEARSASVPRSITS